MITKHSFAIDHVTLIRVIVILIFQVSILVRSEVRLPAVFSDQMVLQRDILLPVWGWADSGEEVIVTFGGESAKTIANNDGRWRVYLDKLEANASSQTLKVSGRNTVIFTNVLVGDVWLCSGQSNMGLYLGECDDAGIEVPTANDPLLRMLTVEERTSVIPDVDTTLWNGKRWRPCTPEVANQFSGVGYFFGKELRRHLGIPIGLISSLKGGSQVQLWTSLESVKRNIAGDPDFKGWLEKREAVLDNYQHKLSEYAPLKKQYDTEMTRYWNEVENAPELIERRKLWANECKLAREQGSTPPKRPEPTEPSPTAPEAPDCGPYNSFMVGNLYNAMIAPLIPFAIKGVIWYQGESNCNNSKQYQTLFPIMIKDWREKWGQGNFPFLFVQLPNINKPAVDPVQDQDRWPGIREAQAMALSLPITGMATIIDVGDPDEVHCKDKMDVGVRLSLIARNLVYKEDVVSSGPTYALMNIDGNRILLTFTNIGSGLAIGVPPWTPSGKIPPVASELTGFAIAGPDKRWFKAQAMIIGSSQIVVSSEHVLHPEAVRYAWADNPPCNLYNKEKLPAAPFRTDNWDPSTLGQTTRN